MLSRAITLNTLRYILMLPLIAVLWVGISSYSQPIKAVPECALENHHGLGNCPIQALRSYPHLYGVSITKLQKISTGLGIKGP
jgi:hypothetical protein